MEDCLREELIKLKKDEIYCEIGANKRTIHLAFSTNRNIQVYVVDDEYSCDIGIDDPCVRLNFLQGKSEDICDEWFKEANESFISVLMINENFEKNFSMWKEYVKPKGMVILKTDRFNTGNYKPEIIENYSKVRL